MSLVFESLYSAQTCANAPFLMTTFLDTVNQTSYYVFKEVENSIFYPYCNTNPIASFGGCCLSSMINGQLMNNGYDPANSFRDEVITSLQQQPFPAASRGRKYCRLSQNAASTSYTYSLLYNNTYLLADGSCISESFQCFSSGILSVWNGTSCSGTAQNFTSGGAVTSTVIGGSVDFLLVNITATSGAPNTWIGFMPVYLVVPTVPVWGIEIFGLICVCAGVLGSLWMGITESYAIIHLGIRKRIPFAISQIFWVIYCVLSIAWWVSVVPSVQTYQIIYEFRGIAYNIATYLTTYETTETLLKMNYVSDWRKRYAAHSVLIVTSFILAGGNYICYLSNNPVAQQAVSSWLSALPAWDLVVFTYDTFPPLLFILICINEQARKAKKDFWIVFMGFLNLYGFSLSIMIFNTLVRFILDGVICYTSLAGDDRTQLALAAGPYCLSGVLLSYANSRLNQIAHYYFESLRLVTHKVSLQKKNSMGGDASAISKRHSIIPAKTQILPPTDIIPEINE